MWIRILTMALIAQLMQEERKNGQDLPQSSQFDQAPRAPETHITKEISSQLCRPRTQNAAGFLSKESSWSLMSRACSSLLLAFGPVGGRLHVY